MVQPTPQTWTLRLKHHTTTLLLHVQPLTTLPQLRQEILKALHQTNPSGSFGSYTIPQNADEIILARPVDHNDFTLGWERIETASTDDDVVADSGKGKGKAVIGAVGQGKKKAVDAANTVQGAGLRDGGACAFRFKTEDDAARAAKESEKDEGLGEEEGQDGETLVGEGEKEDWDVVLPVMEEAEYTEAPMAKMGGKEV